MTVATQVLLTLSIQWQSYFEKAAATDDDTLRVTYEDARQRFFEDLSEEDARAAFARLTPQPLGVYLEPAEASARELEARKRYVVCLRDVTFPLVLERRLAARLGGSVDGIDSGHDPMLSHPAEPARLLVS